MPRAGRVAVKVSPSQPIGAGLMLQDLTHWALYVQVHGKSRLDNI